MKNPFGNLFDVPYRKNRHNEIILNCLHPNFHKRRRTIERRLKRLLDSGRIKRVTTQTIDLGGRILYTYQYCFKNYQRKKEKSHADRFSKLQKEES